MNFTIEEKSNGKNIFTLYSEFRFINHQTIEPLILAYETYGRLSKNKDNVILIHHALSSDSHVNSHNKNYTRGWWENMIGPNKAINTNKFFVICINILGSCFGSSGSASINPKTNIPYQDLFPDVDIADMVQSQKLLLDYLGINKLVAIIGGSMGGMLSLTWSILYPNTAEKLILIATALKAYPSNIAYRSIQRNIINLGLKTGNEYLIIQAFLIARKYALLSYRNQKNLEKCFSSQELLEKYLIKNAESFTNKFNIYSYLNLLNALDKFNVYNYEINNSNVFKKINANTLIISVSSDSLYPSDQQEELYQEIKLAGKFVNYIKHHSNYGHDAFLIEIDSFSQYINKFISSRNVCNFAI